MNLSQRYDLGFNFKKVIKSKSEWMIIIVILQKKLSSLKSFALYYKTSEEFAGCPAERDLRLNKAAAAPHCIRPDFRRVHSLQSLFVQLIQTICAQLAISRQAKRGRVGASTIKLERFVSANLSSISSGLFHK